MWRGKVHCRKAGSLLVDWPAHFTDTRAQSNNIHTVISNCLLSSHGGGKIRANHLTQSVADEDHADPCMACSSLEMKQEQQRWLRASPISEHQRLRKLDAKVEMWISSWPRTQVRESQWLWYRFSTVLNKSAGKVLVQSGPQAASLWRHDAAPCEDCHFKRWRKWLLQCPKASSSHDFF